MKKAALSAEQVGQMLGSAVLVVLVDDLPAMKAMVVWPAVYHLHGAQRMRRWSQASGIPQAELKRVIPKLLGNGVCRDDGTVDEMAVALAQKLIVKMMGGK